MLIRALVKGGFEVALTASKQGLRTMCCRLDICMRNILLTGGSGQIGRVFYKAWQGQYCMTLCDRVAPDFDLVDGDRFVEADLSDASTAPRLVAAQDTVIHLAGIPDPNASFDALLPANILATTYLLEAASKAGVRRFVFASSAQAVEGYPLDCQVVDGAAPRPANLYGVTKAYGEALCAFHAQQGEMSCVALRIGAFEREGSSAVTTARDLSAWLSHRDGASLFERAIEAEFDGSFIAHGTSDNRFKRMDLSETKRVLQYDPKDDAFDVFEAQRLLKL